MNIKQILSALRKSPRDIELLIKVVNFYLSRKEFKLAEEYIRKTYRLEPDNALVLMMSADINSYLDGDRKAINVYKKIFKLTDRQIATCSLIGTVKRAAGFRNDMRYNMALNYWNLKQYSQAKMWAEKYLKDRQSKKLYTKNNIKEVREFVVDCKDRAAIEKAMDTENWFALRIPCRRQLRRYPLNQYLWSCLIVSYYARDEYRKSLELSSKVLKKFPDDGCIQFNHAGALQMLERFDEAIEIFDRLARSSEKQLVQKYQAYNLAEARRWKNDACFRLGCCYAETGKIRQARYWLNKYIEGRKAGMGGIYNLNLVKKVLRELSADCPAD